MVKCMKNIYKITRISKLFTRSIFKVLKTAKNIRVAGIKIMLDLRKGKKGYEINEKLKI